MKLKSFKDHDVYKNNFFGMSHTLKRNWFRFGKKKIQNLKSSYLRNFMEKNNEICNVNSTMVFPWFYVKKKTKTKKTKKKQYFSTSKKRGVLGP